MIDFSPLKPTMDGLALKLALLLLFVLIPGVLAGILSPRKIANITIGISCLGGLYAGIHFVLQ